MSRFEEEPAVERLQKLRGHDKLAYEFGKMLGVMEGIVPRIIRRPKGASRTSVDDVVDVLKGSGCVDWETGLSSRQISKETRVGLRQTQRAIKELLRKNVIKRTQQGRQTRYFLTQPLR